ASQAGEATAKRIHAHLNQRRAAAGAGAENARAAGRLSPFLRGKVEAAIEPGEQLLWVEQPGAQEYLLHAPLDVPVAAGIVAGILFFTAAAFVSAPLVWGAFGLACLLAAGARLSKQVRGTLYALTDRRGL